METTSQPKPNFLFASDLDGTLIPTCREHHDPLTRNRFCSAIDANPGLALAYVTGRDLALTLQGCREHHLPQPQWIIGDVGTSMYIRDDQDGWVLCEAYRDVLKRRTNVSALEAFRDRVAGLDAVERQPDRCQAEFKHSFFIDAEAPGVLEEIRAENERRGCPARIIFSEDPVRQIGLLDLLPPGVSKATAVDWLYQSLDLPLEKVVFAGDSGNDFDAFCGPWKSILVGNTPESIQRDVLRRMRQARSADTVYVASAPCLAGVMEGLHHFQVPGFIRQDGAAGSPG